MRVNPNNIYGPSTSGTQSAERLDGRNGSRGSSSIDSGAYDNADISLNASVLSRVLAQSSSARTQRVSELQNQVQSGAYMVDSQALSGSLVKDMLASGLQK